MHLQPRILFHPMISTLSCTTIVAMGLILPYGGQIQRNLYCSRCMRSMWRGMKLIFCLSRVVGIVRISISLQVTRLRFGLCMRSTPTPEGIRLQTYPLDPSSLMWQMWMALSFVGSDMYGVSYDFIECSFSRPSVKFDRAMPSRLAI